MPEIGQRTEVPKIENPWIERASFYLNAVNEAIGFRDLKPQEKEKYGPWHLMIKKLLDDLESGSISELDNKTMQELKDKTEELLKLISREGERGNYYEA